ncbi:MAG: DUF3105 domain-containing protein [Nocardioidaceae bacterium]|nr:DUF3105 domain-containing protein [Nocardioidaceae bacterium]
MDAQVASVESLIVAKKDKNLERNERRERMERMRREAQRAERRRTLTVVGACAVVALVIVSLTGWKLYQDNQEAAAIEGTPLADIGVSAGAAGCQDIVTEPAEGSSQHEETGTTIDYPDAPPAFGPHWDDQPEFDRHFSTAEDRLPVERLVHYAEHGYATLWYDETIADDPEQLAVVEDLGAKFDIDDPGTIEELNANKFVAVPWTSEDGEPFPDGAHVALTHWSAATEGGEGIWQYCDQPSGEVVETFMADYPASDSPEPTAG